MALGHSLRELLHRLIGRFHWRDARRLALHRASISIESATCNDYLKLLGATQGIGTRATAGYPVNTYDRLYDLHRITMCQLMGHTAFRGGVKLRNPFVDEAIRQMAIADADIEVPARVHYAQCAEDLIVLSLLRAVADRNGIDLAAGRYLEVGANHPVAASATYLLHVELGMTGVLVEANPSLISELQRARPQDVVVNKAVHAADASSVELFVSNHSEITSLSREFVESWQEGKVGLKRVDIVAACRINQILEDFFPRAAPVFLSIDVEGKDLDLLRDLDWQRWRPIVVQAEPSEHFIPENAAQIAAFMAQHDYVQVARTDVNQIFLDGRLVRSSLLRTTPLITPSSSPNEGRDTPTVGIVTRTKNRTVLLRRALESVRDQTWPHWQLVVVNDGGAREPVDWLVGQLFAGDARVRIIHHATSTGMEAASNAGLSIMDTDYAVIHDDDDSWAPEFLSSMVTTITRQKKAFPSIKGIACRANNVFETVTGNEIILERIEPFVSWHSDQLNEGFLSVQKMLVRNQFPPIVFLFDLQAGQELGLFDATLPVLGDWDFHSRFVLKHDIWILPEYLAFYHHRTTATGSLGNTVHAGASRHHLYNQKIRNNLIRQVVGEDGSGRMSLTIPMEIQELAQNEFGSINWRLGQIEGLLNSLRPERPKWRRNLSKWFRRWRNKILRRGDK